MLKCLRHLLATGTQFDKVMKSHILEQQLLYVYEVLLSEKEYKDCLPVNLLFLFNFSRQLAVCYFEASLTTTHVQHLEKL